MDEDDFEEKPKRVITREDLVAKVEEQIIKYLTRFKTEFDSYVSEAREFLAGKGDMTSLGKIDGGYSRAVNFEDLSGRVEAIFDTLKAIGHEKGFRSHIDTYNEHKAIRSTVWVKYKEQPDVPIGILNYLWDNGDEDERLTIEEARRARELEGMTTIDENGVVTNRKNDDVKDSYYFLSPKRRAEIISLEARTIESMQTLSEEIYSREKKSLEEFKDYFVRFIEGKYTFLELQEKVNEIKRITEPFGIDFSGIEDYAIGVSIIDQARELSYREGHRDFYLTPQELTILGRSVDSKYLQRPWTPIGIQDRTLTIGDAQTIRRGEKEIKWMTAVFTEFEMPFPIHFEELNQDGETISGPNGTNAEMAKHFKDRAKVPYARQADWYFKDL